MRIAVYPGSFSPWHAGHTDVLNKALKVFDKVILAIGQNPDKSMVEYQIPKEIEDNPKVEVRRFSGFLIDFTRKVNANAVIRGLRNSTDMEYERTQQYWNEDLGITIPTVYFISDRKLVHISSSAIKAVEKLKKGDL